MNHYLMIEALPKSTTIQAVAIGILLLGVATVSFAAYSGSQASPYLVQVDNESSVPTDSVASYENLSSPQKAIIDRIITGQDESNEGGAAQVEGESVGFWANHVIQYQDKYYTFDIHQEDDDGYLMTLFLGVGYVITSVGVALFLLSHLVFRRQVASTDTHTP